MWDFDKHAYLYVNLLRLEHASAHYVMSTGARRIVQIGQATRVAYAAWTLRKIQFSGQLGSTSSTGARIIRHK